ncbi:MAG: molybdopterin-dependent oxidoreductase [Burkholderiaceae bacterium]
MNSTQFKPSVCPLDCPDTCSLSVEVSNDTVISVRGSDANPYTASAICNKVAHLYPDVIHGPGRLTHPLRRSGPKGAGQFEPISWTAALDLVHDGFNRVIDEYGPQAVMPLNYAGPHGQLAGGSMDRRFFHRLGASLLDRGPLCGAVRGTAYTSVFGPAPGMAPDQAVHADVIAVWGNNVTVSNMHLAPVIKRARANGASLVVVDPKRTRIAEQADLYVQIKPGTDVVLALALAAQLERLGSFKADFIARWVHGFDDYMAHARQFPVSMACEVCNITKGQFDALAGQYAKAKNLALSIGNGIERGQSGGSGLRAIMSLNVLTGQLGRPGAGVIAKPGLAFPYNGDALQRPDFIPAGTRTFNIVDAAKVMLDKSLAPPIGAVFIYNHNPVATHPDQNRMRRALAQKDIFVVGSDIVMTDSMLFADVILPAASHFEHGDVYGAYGQSYLQRAAPVIKPVGNSLPNTEIFRRLAARFGFTEAAFLDTDTQLMDAALVAGDYRLQGFLPSELPLDRALMMKTENDEPMLMCHNVKPATTSGKIELFSQAMQDQYGFGLPRYEPVDHNLPFNLISPSSIKRTNATFGGHGESAGPELVEINPVDATRLNITDGQTVTLFNGLGQVTLTARVSDAVAAGVLYSPKGTWLKTSGTGQTVNALIDSERRTDIAAGACYNDTWVDIRV